MPHILRAIIFMTSLVLAGTGCSVKLALPPAASEAGRTQTQPLVLAGTTAPSVAVAGTSSFTITATNTGTDSLGFSTRALLTTGTDTGTEFSITGGTCVIPGTLAAGSSCTMTANFTPLSAGSRSDTLTIRYTVGVDPTIVTSTTTLAGTGLGPAVLTLSAVTFPNTTVGASSAAQTMTVTNTGGLTATLSTRTLTSTAATTGTNFSITGGTCTNGGTIASGASCTMTIVFSPSSATSLSDTVQVDYNDGASAQSVTRAVSGTGLTVALLTLSAVTFPDTLSSMVSAAQTMTVTNTGGSPASMTGQSSGGTITPFVNASGGTCTIPGTLAAGSSCTILITLSYPSRGSSSVTYQVGYNNGVSAQTATRSISGLGLSPALLTLSSVSFRSALPGATTNHSSSTTTVTNSGDVDATAISGTLPAQYVYRGVGGTYPGTAGTCGSTLSAGSTCTILFEFSPTVTGYIGGVYSLTYHDGASTTSTSTVFSALSYMPLGAGIANTSNPALTSSEWDFGYVRVGGTGWYIWTLINRSQTAAALTISASGSSTFSTGASGTTADAPEILVDSGYRDACSSSLGAGMMCDVLVKYMPTAASGVETATITAQVGSETLLLSLSGSGETPLNCSCNTADDFYSHNSGDTEADAYRICTEGHITMMNTRFDMHLGWAGKYFRQCGDIVGSGTTSIQDSIGSGTTLSGASVYQFQGQYDGNDYVIRNFYFRKAIYNCAGGVVVGSATSSTCMGGVSSFVRDGGGLFYSLGNNAVVKNLGLKRNGYGGIDRGGPLASIAKSTTGQEGHVSYVWSSNNSVSPYQAFENGAINTSQDARPPGVWGGLIGHLDGAYILDHVFSNESLMPNDAGPSAMQINSSVGGLVGLGNNFNTITNSFYAGGIEILLGAHAKWIGGIVGGIESGSIENVYSVAGRIQLGDYDREEAGTEAEGRAGGVVGAIDSNASSTLQNVANFSLVKTYGLGGGIAASLRWRDTHTPTKMANYGAVYATTDAGGVCGYCYFTSDVYLVEKWRNEGYVEGAAVSRTTNVGAGGVFGKLVVDALNSGSLDLDNLVHVGSVFGLGRSMLSGALAGWITLDQTVTVNLSHTLTVVPELRGTGEGWIGYAEDETTHELRSSPIQDRNQSSFLLSFDDSRYTYVSNDVCVPQYVSNGLNYFSDGNQGTVDGVDRNGIPYLGGLPRNSARGSCNVMDSATFEDSSLYPIDTSVAPAFFRSVWLNIVDFMW